MADRHDYYFRQVVSEAELDEGFAWLEQADWDLVTDQGFDGVVSGLAVAENTGSPDLTVDITGGVAYSHQGERIAVVGNQDLDLSVDDASASTAVGSSGNEKWISVFVEFDRLLATPKIDGSSLTVYFDRLESYTFSVVQGAEALAGAATPPALDTGKILLADVLLAFGQTTIENADIYTTRRETRTFPTASISYGGGPAWADGTTNPATNIESQIDKMITNLAQETAGSDRILSAAVAGSPNALVQGSIYNQIGQLLTDINNHQSAASGAHAGTAISNTPAGAIVATTVQAAINELDTKKLAIASNLAPKAVVLVSTGGGSPNVLFSAGVSGVTYSGGDIRVTFSTAFTGTQTYGAEIQIQTPPLAVDEYPYVNLRTLGYAEIGVYNNAGSGITLSSNARVLLVAFYGV